MEIYKRPENYKDPVNTAKSNFAALGFLYFIVALMFFASNRMFAYIMLASCLLVMLSAYFLSRRKIAGVYVAWFFILFGIVDGLMSGAILSLLIVLYLAFWNYKAQKALTTSVSEQINPTPQV